MSRPEQPVRTLTIVAARLVDPLVGAIRAVIQDWSAVDLVGPSVWVDVEGDPHTGLVVAEGRGRPTDLVAWLARNRTPVRLVVLQVLSNPDQALTVRIPQTIAQALQLGSAVPVVNLLAPVEGLTGVPAGAAFHGHVNLILQPVDGAHPTAPTEPLRANSATFPMHVAAGLATATGMWRAMASSPLDAEYQWTGTQVAAARAYVRTLDTSEVLATMGALVFGTNDRLPVTRTRQGYPSPVIPDAGQLAAAEAAGQSLVAKHADVTFFRPPPPFVPKEPTGLPLRQALAMFFSFLFKAAFGAPRAWAQGLVDDLRERVERAATSTLFGPDGRFRVVLGGYRGALPADRVEQTAQAVIQALPQGSIPAPTAAPDLWSDAQAAAACLVDGGIGPDGVELPRYDPPPVIDIPDRIAARPGSTPFRLPSAVNGPDGIRQIEPNDPFGALQVRRDLQRQILQVTGPGQALSAHAGPVVVLQDTLAKLDGWIEHQRSYTWTVSALIGQQLDAAATLLGEVLSPTDQLTAADLAAPLDQQSKVRRGVLAWLGLFVVALIALVVVAVLALVAWPILLAVGVVVLIGILFGAVKSFARNQAQLFRLINRLENDADRRRWLDANAREISEAVVRLSSVYRQSRAWMAIIAENVHDPFGAGTQAGVHDPVPGELSGDLPLAVTLTAASYSPDTHEAALHGARNDLLRAGWLSRQFAHRRDHVRADLARRTGNDPGDGFWTDAAVLPGGAVDQYLAGLRDPNLRAQVYRSAIRTLAGAVTGPGWEARLLPRVTVRAGAIRRDATWPELTDDLFDPTGQPTNTIGFSETGVMRQANLIRRSYLTVNTGQPVPAGVQSLATTPFAEGHALDRVVIRWDMSAIAEPDQYSYFAEDGPGGGGGGGGGVIDVDA